MAEEYVGFVRAELSFNGGENRKYDANLAWWRDPQSTQESSKLFFTVMRNGFAGYNPQAVSINRAIVLQILISFTFAVHLTVI